MPEHDTDSWRELTCKLAQPFDTVEFLPRNPRDGQALAIAYIDARDVQTRLDVVCGGNWSFDFELLSPDGKMVKGKLTVCGVTRCDAGEADQEGEPLKSAVSDALKRCAVHFGIGRYLYHLPKVWGKYDQSKRRFTEPPAFEQRVISKAVSLAIGQTLGHPTPYTPGPMPSREEAAANRAAEAQEPAAPPVPDSSGDRKASQEPKPTEARRSPWAAGVTQPDRTTTGEAPKQNANGLTCARAECGRAITRGQHEMSVKNYGKGYCPACQKLQARTAEQPPPRGYLGGGNASAPPADAPAPSNKDEVTRARESYMARFHERFGKMGDRERYCHEAVLLGLRDPLEKGSKDHWTADGWIAMRDKVDGCDPEDVKAAARELVNVNREFLTPPVQQAAPNGLAAS